MTIKVHTTDEALKLAASHLDFMSSDWRSFASSNRAVLPEYPKGSGVALRLETDAQAYEASVEAFDHAIDAIKDRQALLGKLRSLEARAAAIQPTTEEREALGSALSLLHNESFDAEAALMQAFLRRMEAPDAGRALLERLHSLEEQIAQLATAKNALHSFLGVIVKEMEVFCDVNCTVPVHSNTLSAALSMMARWRMLIETACGPKEPTDGG